MKKISETVSVILAVLLCQPPASYAQQSAQPSSELITIVEHYDKCEADANAKNLASASEWCKKGLASLKGVRVKDDQFARLSARLQQKHAEVSAADRMLDGKVKSARDLSHQMRLEAARQRLDETRDYEADPPLPRSRL